MRCNGSTPYQHPFKALSTPFKILFDKKSKIYIKFQKTIDKMIFYLYFIFKTTKKETYGKK